MRNGKMLRAYGANGLLDPVAHGLADVMNGIMQMIVLVIPGGPGCQPRERGPASSRPASSAYLATPTD
jgi:hypothetical protein